MTMHWQNELINAVTDPKELLELLELDSCWLEQAQAAAKLFPLRVPRGFIARIQKKNIFDPLLRQILPLGEELDHHAGYSRDPLQEKNVNPAKGLLQKYHGRVLLTLTSVCAVHCRYCFRRHFPYSDNNPGTAGWAEALRYIERDKTITEVILSGGDPLAVSDHLLDSIIQKIAAIPHIKRLRIHSRVPIVLPERITAELIQAMTRTFLKPVLVVHCNHPQEINESVIDAMKKLASAGVVLLNQSVLLKGINDDVQILADLSEAVFAAGILPYYLHVMDKVEGAQHFDLERSRARELHSALANRLSGYLVPRLVVEEPGALSKLNL